jgi:hypothetical protein
MGCFYSGLAVIHAAVACLADARVLLDAGTINQDAFAKLMLKALG